MIRIDKQHIRKLKMTDEQDDGFVEATMRQRIEMVWNITVALWAVSTRGRGKVHAESRLQRDVTVFSRRTD